MTTLTQPFGLINPPLGFQLLGSLKARIAALFRSTPNSDAEAGQRLRAFAEQYAQTQPSYASDLRAAADWYDVYK